MNLTRQKVPDKKNALSIAEAAKRDMDFTLTMQISEKSASTIAKNIYDCFRMLGDALLVFGGIESADHYLPMKKLQELKIEASRSIYLIDNLRKLRNNISYYGYKPTIEEVQDAISIAKSLFEPIFKKILGKMNS